MDEPLPDPLIQTRKQHAQTQPRGSHGRFAPKQAPTPSESADHSSPPPIVSNPELKTAANIPPMVSFSLTNPVTYLKIWWKKVMSGEGIDLRFRIHPLTAIALVTILVAGGAGIGWATKSVLTQVPVVKEFVLLPTPTPMPTPTPDPWKNAAYTGQLKQAGGNFYLVTTEAEAITLQIPENVNLTKHIGKRILAIGKFNRFTNVLKVSDATDLEILIQSTAVPTVIPSPTATRTPSPTPTLELIPLTDETTSDLQPTN